MRIVSIISLLLSIIFLLPLVSFAGWVIETLPLKPAANYFLLGKVEVPPNQNYEKIHVLAYTSTYPEEGMLYLAVREGSSWQVEEICSPGSHVEGFDIASGEQGVGIVFREGYGEDKVIFGKKDGSQWAFETLDSGTDIGFSPQLRTNLLGDFYLVYLNEDVEKDMWKTIYIERSSNSWQREEMTELYEVDIKVLDNSPWMLARMDEAKSSPYGLCHKESNSWSCEQIDWGTWYGAQLEFDSNNQPIIAVADYMSWPSNILFVRKNDGEWTAEVVLNNVLEPNHYFSLTYSSDGVAIAYSTPEDEKMKVYAVRESSGWAKEFVDEIPATEESGIIQIIRALSRNGKIGIFYRCNYSESKNKDVEELRLAYEEGFFPEDDDDIDDDTDDDFDDDNNSEEDGDKSGCGCSMR